MSLYDKPLPPADYAAYLALRDQMCDLALPYLGHFFERQKSLQELGYLKSVDLASATALRGETPCRVQFIGRGTNGRWQWAWDDPPGIYPPEALRDALHLKAYGEQHGIEWLTRSGWPMALHGQEDTLHALAVMLNHADGYCLDSAPCRLKEHLPDAGQGWMLMTVYLTTPRQTTPRSKETVKEVVDDLGHCYKAPAAIAAYLDSLPPELHPQPVCPPMPQPRKYPAHINYFPEESTVFTAAQPWLAKHLLPIASFDLASLDPALGDTRLHFIKPIEPRNYIGDNTRAAHTDYCGINWLCFHLEDDGTYRFLAEEAFFRGENAEPNMRKYLAKVRSSYQQIKQLYRESGILVEKLDENHLPCFSGPLRFLPHFYFMDSWYIEPPPAFTLDKDDDSRESEFISSEDKLLYQDNRFTCIADNGGYSWGEGETNTIYLLYEPQSRLVLIIL